MVVANDVSIQTQSKKYDQEKDPKSKEPSMLETLTLQLEKMTS